MRLVTWAGRALESLLGPEEAQAGRPDVLDGLELGAGDPAEERSRAAGGHRTQKARHGAHEEELSSLFRPPPVTSGRGGGRGGGRSGRKSAISAPGLSQHACRA